MSMLLVHELHEVRDRVLLLCQKLETARDRELPAYRPIIEDEINALRKALDDARIPDHYRVAVVGRFKVGKSSFVNKLAQETGKTYVKRYTDNPYRPLYNVITDIHNITSYLVTIK